MALLKSVSVGLSSRLRVTVLRCEGFSALARMVCGKSHNCCKYRDESNYFLPAKKIFYRLSHTIYCCQRRPWSSMTVNAPQLDLRPEVEKATDKKIDASEVLRNLNPEDARKLKIIKLEFDAMEQMNSKLPEKMTDENWLAALQLDSRAKRSSYYTFLFKREMKRKSAKAKQEKKQQERAMVPKEEKEQSDKNTIFMIVYDTTIKKAGNYRLAQAMQFGPPLVFDMDYEQYMRQQDCQNLVNQFLMAYSTNRESRDPFHLILTSLNPHGHVIQMLQQAKLTGQHFMGTMTDKSYLDLFPKEQLVYLSPHASQPLEKMNEDDVYIIGGFVDKAHAKPVSLARAKEQGIRMAKLPLDLYLLWGLGSKSLTIDQMMEILLEQRRTKDWLQAFKVIPKRKLYREDRET